MTPRAPEPANFVRSLFITVLGSGYAPFASGTWGSAAAIILFLPWWFLVAYAYPSRPLLEAGIVCAVAISAIIAVRWGPWAVHYFQRKDPKQFVLDEFGGQWVALVAIPIALDANLWTLACALATQFFLFRAFDIIKLAPARQIEDWPDGWGIYFDDIVAGIYANICGQLIWRLTPLPEWLATATT